MTVTGAVELLEAAKAEDTVSGGAHNVDGLSLTLGLAEDPVGKSGEGRMATWVEHYSLCEKGGREKFGDEMVALIT